MKYYTTERINTSSRGTVANEHIHRYLFCEEFVRNKIVLDIASGEGYGSNLLSKHAEYVIGVDISDAAVKSASMKYSRTNLSFKLGSTNEIPLEDNSVDIVVSFETIEHHDEHLKMLDEISRVLRPNGILIISTPDKKKYSDDRNYNNIYHVKELTKYDFEVLLRKYFSNNSFFVQGSINEISHILNEDIVLPTKYLSGDFDNYTMDQLDFLYQLSVSSNGFIKQIENSVFSYHHSQDKLNFEFQRGQHFVMTSWSFKIGAFLLRPFKIFKRYF